MRATIKEIYRILKPGGKAILVVRTTDDYRYGKGRKIGENTYVMDIEETNEKDMIIYFFDLNMVSESFKDFRILGIEKTETTLSNRMIKNSDWIIVAEKPKHFEAVQEP